MPETNRTNKALLTIALVAILAFSVFVSLHLNGPIGQEAYFYIKFGVVPQSNFAFPFSPPVSMYRALQIGLESQGYDKMSLIGMSVTADFVYAFMDTGAFKGGSSITRWVTTPPTNYSSTIVDFAGVYDYAWAITVNHATNPSSTPVGFCLVDAQTGALLSKPIPP
jgi:hypothetical protein